MPSDVVCVESSRRTDELGQTRWLAVDYAEAIHMEPDAFSELRLGILLLHAGELDRYRTHCQALLGRWPPTER